MPTLSNQPEGKIGQYSKYVASCLVYYGDVVPKIPIFPSSLKPIVVSSFYPDALFKIGINHQSPKYKEVDTWDSLASQTKLPNQRNSLSKQKRTKNRQNTSDDLNRIGPNRFMCFHAWP